MKSIFKTLFLLAFIVSLLSLKYQMPDYALNKASKIQGVFVFINSEPIAPYEITGKVSSDDLNTLMEDCPSLKDNLNALVSNASRKAKKGKFEFDAIITDDSNTGICIKFKQ